MAAAPDTTKTPEMLTLQTKDIVNSDELVFSEPQPTASTPARAPKLEERKEETETSGISLVEQFEDDVILREISIKEKVEDARGQLAKIFTLATFLLFILGFILAALAEGDKINNLKEIFLTISGIFSGLLGFVIGYYFRKGEEK